MQASDPSCPQRQSSQAAVSHARQEAEEPQQQQQHQQEQAAPAASVPGGGPGGSAAGAAARATLSQEVAAEVTQAQVQAYHAHYAELQQQQQELQAGPEGGVPLPVIQASTAPTPLQRPAVSSDPDTLAAAQVPLPQPSQAQPQGRSAIELPPPSIVLPPGPGQVPLVQRGSRLVPAPAAGSATATQAAQQRGSEQQQALLPPQSVINAGFGTAPPQRASVQQQSLVQQHGAVTSPSAASRVQGSRQLTQQPDITTPETALSDQRHAPQRDAVEPGQQQTPQKPAVPPAVALSRPAPDLPAPPAQPVQTTSAELHHVASGADGLAQQHISPVKATQPPVQTAASLQQRPRMVSTETADQEWAEVVARKAVPVGSPRYCRHPAHTCFMHIQFFHINTIEMV